MSQPKTTADGVDSSGPYGQIRLPDDKDTLGLESAPQEKRLSRHGSLRRAGVLSACITLCVGAFLVVVHHKSPGLDSHLPPVRDLQTPQTASGLSSEELVYADPVDAWSRNTDNCTSPAEWTFVDAGCGHAFERGNERFPTSASKKFTLLVDEKEDIQFSRWGNARIPGVAHIVLADDIGKKDIQVDVTTYMHDKEIFEQVVKVCRSGQPASTGERFHVQADFPRWAVKDPSHAMFMEMTVHLPRGAASSPLRMKNLRVVLGESEVVIGDLSDGVVFDNVQLITQSAAIDVESVTAGQPFVHASGGAIRGSFNVFGDLAVLTTNAPLDINATLTASPDSSSQIWPLFDMLSPGSASNGTRASNKLKLQTTNGAITADIVFSAEEHNQTYSDSADQHFGAELKTTNAPIDVVFSSLPGGRQLQAGLITQFANATVTLPPNFSGPVCVQSRGAHWTEPNLHDTMYGGQTAEDRGVQFVNNHGEGGMSECADVEQLPSYTRVMSLYGGIEIHV